MKIKAIAEKHGLPLTDFEKFLIAETDIKVNRGFVDNSIADDDEKRAVELWHAHDNKVQQIKATRAQAAEKQAEREREREIDKSRVLPTMLITSGFSFDGYRIVKYSGYISGDDATQIPRSGVFGGYNGQNLTNALVRIRRQAIKELKEAAYDLGCNAVIGVDFD